jgi:hypothetical protein
MFWIAAGLMFWIAVGLMILADTECACLQSRDRDGFLLGVACLSQGRSCYNQMVPQGHGIVWMQRLPCSVCVFAHGGCGYKPSFLVTMQCLCKMYSNFGLGRVCRTNKLLLRLVLYVYL